MVLIDTTMQVRIDGARDAVRRLQGQYPEAFAVMRAEAGLRQVGHKVRSKLLMNAEAKLDRADA